MRIKLIASAAALAAAAPAYADLLITDVSIVSPERSRASAPVSVHIGDDGRIAEISARVSRRARRARQRIDGGGMYLSPGLIDGHTHLDEIPGMTTEQEAQFAEIAAAARRQIPRSYLYHGFTTVVDLNGRADVVHAWNSAPWRPHAHFCGGTPIVNGYPMAYRPAAERFRIMPYFLEDAERPADFPVGFDRARHSPEAVVAQMRRDGAVCVKAHYEEGFSAGRRLPVPTAETLQRLVTAAHARGMPLLLHASSDSAQLFGLQAGVDAFAHGTWRWRDVGAAEMPETLRHALDEIASRRIGWQPTFQVLYGRRDLFDPASLADDELAQVVPRALLQWYGTVEGGWWRRRMEPGVRELVDSGRWREMDAVPLGRLRLAFSYLAARRARLLFGSDTPSDPTFANPPGLNGRREMRRWIEAGARPDQLFRAATLENAAFFGMDRLVGTVVVGKRADLLLLRADPFVDGDAYDTIVTVIVAGTAIERSQLAAATVGQ